MSNINDTRRTAILTTMGMGLGSESYTCSMSYYRLRPLYGDGTCLPEQVDITAKTTKIASVLASGRAALTSVSRRLAARSRIYNSYRLDPMLCATGPGFAPPSITRRCVCELHCERLGRLFWRITRAGTAPSP